VTRYRYKAYTATGSTDVGDIEADSVADALRLLNERGLTPIKAEPVQSTAAKPVSRSLFSSSRLSLKDYADFTRELAVLLKAELPLDVALKLLGGQTGQPQIKPLIDLLVASVVAGKSLSAALVEHAPDAPNYLASLIKAGEARGTLAPTMADLARFITVRVEIHNKLRSAFTYPIILAVTALIAIAIILTALVPALMPMFTQSGATPPMGLYVAHAISVWLEHNWMLALTGLCAAIIGLKLAVRYESVQALLDRMVLRVPIVGPLNRKTSIAILARTLGTLLHNGVALIPALRIAATAVPNRLIAASLKRAIEDVNSGKRLAKSLEATGQIPPLALRFVAIGEDTSKLDEMLLHLAEISEKEAEQQVDHLMVMMVPIITVVIGVVVGSLIMSVMQAIGAANDVALR
jgi:general secretion pathway protein F